MWDRGSGSILASHGPGAAGRSDLKPIKVGRSDEGGVT